MERVVILALPIVTLALPIVILALPIVTLALPIVILAEGGDPRRVARILTVPLQE